MSLAEALERAATALPETAEAIRPANGDPERVLAALDPEGRARVLGWLLAEEPEAGGELAEAWIEGDAGVAALAAVAEAALPKAGRKVLRRLRHRLRSRGVALAEVPVEPRVAHLPAGAEEALAGAYLSPIDPTGSRLVTFVEPNPTGGARLFQLAVDLRRGVLDCQVYNATHGRVRRFVRDLVERERFRSVEVEPDAARALVARAVAAQAANRPLPRSFAEWRSHLAGAGPGTPTPGELAREALGAETGAGAVRRAVALYRERKLPPWLPAEDRLRPVAEELKALEGESRIIVSGAARREQVEEILARGLAQVFDEPERELLARWLEENAYWFWKTGAEDEARACLAAALDARETPPAESELLRVLLETVLAPVLEQVREEDREREQDSLLVKP